MGKVGASKNYEVESLSLCKKWMYPALSFWHSERIIPYLACEPLTDVQIVKENLESDYFGRIGHRLSIIRNLNNQVLLVHQGSHAVFEDMTDSECEENASQTKIIIYTYKDSYPRGMAVTLSVKCPEMFTLSCMNKNISFKKMSPPADINDEKSDIIFFMRSVPGFNNKMKFESSLYEGYFLACKKEEDFFKLILKERDIDWDDSVMFTVDYKELNIKIS
ncbi:PREDICTED: interleukin-18 isoform X2 [Myotis brandtii]|uniref:interleukin-18 isoform X2 n=1 Tax=Myotis brandtii TaxID=109478 RepID=UPI0007044149|nr:PREDICTED: interleukin-18 isoform X2 [Myotis brandtii]